MVYNGLVPMPTRNKIFLWGGGAAVLVLLLGVGVAMFQRNRVPINELLPVGQETEIPGTPQGPPVFAPSVPEDAVPTLPASEAPAAPGAREQSKTFSVQVSDEGYDPSVITVRLGDLVRLDLTARGGEYDFVMPYSGLSQRVKHGDTKPVSFQATTVGTFDFMCREYCPPGKVIQGKFIVLPR